MAAASTGLATLRRLADRLEGTTAGRLVGRSVAGLVRVEVFDRAMTLAAQAFTSILPIMIAAAALNPRNADQLGTTMAEQLGLSAEASRVLEGSVPDGATVQQSVGLLGIVLILLSATSFSRALERMYARVWDVDRPGVRGAWRWLAALLAIVIALLLLRFTRRVVDDTSYEDLASILLQLVLWTVVWTWVPWLLLKAQVPRRTMWTSGVATGVALTAVAVAGSVYLPVALSAGARQFGALGIAITYIGWLFVVCFALIVGTVVAHAAISDEGRLGRVARGPGVPGASEVGQTASP